MRTPLLLALLCLAPLSACGDKTSDDDDEETDEDEEAGGECYERTNNNGFPNIPSCELDAPCAGVVFNLADEACSADDYDPDAAACIIDALGSATAGEFRITDCPGGQYSESWWLQSLGDGTVIWATNEWDDSDGESRASWRALPDSAYFSACSGDTPEELLSCIGGIEDEACQTGTPECP